MSTAMSTDFLLKGADVLLMLCVVRVASGSVITGDYGDVDAIPSILLWYGLAALYAFIAKIKNIQRFEFSWESKHKQNKKGL